MLKNIPFLTSNNEILMINDQTFTQEINKRTSQRLKLKGELKRKNEMNKTLLRMATVDLDRFLCCYTSSVDLNCAKQQQSEKINRQNQKNIRRQS